MKIVTWNCNGALRNKLAALDKLEADIYVIQECEDPDKSTKVFRNWAGSYLWCGETKNKGIGVFPKNSHSVKHLNWGGEYEISGVKSTSPSLKWATKSLRTFLPFQINDSINVLGVWTKGSNSEVFGYIGQFWKYLQIHRSDLSKGCRLIIGDFNSNTIWDKPDRWWSHTDVVNELKEIGLTSLYHHQYKEEQGAETMPTFFLHKNKNKPYHIDYVFLSTENLSGTVEIGQIQPWLELSDHMPLVINVKRKGDGGIKL